VIIAEFSEMFYLLFAILLAVLDKKEFFCPKLQTETQCSGSQTANFSRR